MENNNLLDSEIFDGKTVKDLFKDIYNRIDEENEGIKGVLDEILEAVASDINSGDAIQVMAPTIKNFIEVSVKNNELLIKLAVAAQKFVVVSEAGVGSYDFNEIQKIASELDKSVSSNLIENEKRIDNLKRDLGDDKKETTERTKSAI